MMPPRTEGMMIPNARDNVSVENSGVDSSNGAHAITSQSPAWLQERCAFWQRQLRLQDWDVTAVWATSIETDGALARTQHSSNLKSARIRVCTEAERGSPSELTRTDYDTEQSLVHELLHLHILDSWSGRHDWGSMESLAREAAIDAIAWALVRLERGERR